jgi:hypothetical protein
MCRERERNIKLVWEVQIHSAMRRGSSWFEHRVSFRPWLEYRITSHWSFRLHAKEECPSPAEQHTDTTHKSQPRNPRQRTSNCTQPTKHCPNRTYSKVLPLYCKRFSVPLTLLII